MMRESAVEPISGKDNPSREIKSNGIRDESQDLFSADEVMRRLQERSTERYKGVKFVKPSAHKASNNYPSRVSFDTINLQYFDNADYNDDEGYPYDDSFPGRGRDFERVPTTVSSFSSPERVNRLDGMNRSLTKFRHPYPTRPIVTHKGCTFTKVHRKFDDLYAGKLNNKENNWLRPVLPSRTILVYLSGRQHTWVALDWIIRNFIEQGDTVVVVAAVTSFDFRRRESLGVSPDPNFRKKNHPKHMTKLSQNIMSYIMDVINPNVITKVTLELALGRTKDILKEMYKLYEPNLVCTGSKMNQKRSAPLKSWLSSRLSDRLVKNFPLPVIVVPACNLVPFEKNLEKEIKSHSGAYDLPVSNRQNEDDILRIPSYETDSDSDVSSTSSISTNSSQGSYSSFEEIAKFYVNYKQDLRADLTSLSDRPIGEDYYASFLRSIGDRSSVLCQEIRNVNPEPKGKGSNLAKLITGSNSFGDIPYRTKSMIYPEEVETNSRDALSFKEVKEKLKNNTVPAPPNIIEHPPPSSRTTRFEVQEAPSKSRSSDRPQILTKHLSHEMDARETKKPLLEPRRSHPHMKMHQNEETDGKEKSQTKRSSKMKKFLKIFT